MCSKTGFAKLVSLYVSQMVASIVSNFDERYIGRLMEKLMALPRKLLKRFGANVEMILQSLKNDFNCAKSRIWV